MRSFRRRGGWPSLAASAALVFAASGAAGTRPAGAGRPAGGGQTDSCAFRFIALPTHEGYLDERRRISRVRLTLWYADPGTSVSLVRPYYGSAHSDVNSLPRPLAFLSDFSSARSGAEGRLERFTISFLGELELAIRSPGCAPVPLRCDETACSG